MPNFLPQVNKCSGSYATCVLVEPVLVKTMGNGKTFSIYYSFHVIDRLKRNNNMTNALVLQFEPG